jgi:hypothetical protein
MVAFSPIFIFSPTKKQKMKIRLLCLLFLTVTQTTFGQLNIQNMNLLKSEELKELVKRPMLVVEYTEGQIRSNDMDKELSKAKGEAKERKEKINEEYLASNKVMKDNFENAVKENWQLNDLSGLKTVTFEEAREIAKSKSKAYCLIYLRSLGPEHNYLAMHITGKVNGGVVIPVMAIQGSENFGGLTDYVGFPLMNSTDRRSFVKSDIEITVRILNQHVTESLKSEKPLKTKDFVESQIAENCNLKRKLKLHVNAEFVEGLDEQQISKAWQGAAEVQSQDVFLQSYSGSSDDAFAILMPMAVSEAAAGPVSRTSTVYGRIAVQASTGKILGFSKSKTGQKLAKEYFNEGHFTDIAACE